MYKKRRLKKIAKRCGLNWRRFREYCVRVKELRRAMGTSKQAAEVSQ